jgi:hypothetical protein
MKLCGRAPVHEHDDRVDSSPDEDSLGQPANHRMSRAVPFFHRRRTKGAFVEVAVNQIFQALAAEEVATRDKSPSVTPDLID